MNDNEEKNNYPTIDFIDDLLLELEIQQKELSILFGKKNRYIDDTKNRMRNPTHPKYYPNFMFSLENIQILKKNIKNKYPEKKHNCYKFINKYIDLNEDLKKYAKQQYHFYHPNLKANYFREIDTKTKAYWLGFFCADGFISKNRYGRLGIELSNKDKKHLIKFCKIIGLEVSFIKERTRIIEYKEKLMKYHTVVIDFWCKPIYEDLISYDFKNFPALDSSELYLSWLLGLYDGDGFQGKTMICSRTKELLIEIKNYFKIKYEIRDYYYDSDVGYHLRIKKDNKDTILKNLTRLLFLLTLGAELFNLMMDNYQDSLKRKRRYFRSNNS